MKTVYFRCPWSWERRYWHRYEEHVDGLIHITLMYACPTAKPHIRIKAQRASRI